MKSLRPLTTLILGALFTGIVCAIIAIFELPGPSTPRDIVIFFSIGALFGLLMLAPIAAAEAFRSGIVRLLGQHSFRVWWHVSLLMAFAMGYIIGSIRHKGFDWVTIVAGCTVFGGAMIKIMMGIALKPYGRRVA